MPPQQVASRSPRSDLDRAADLVDVARDLLATHLGPDGEHRTPDAAVVEDPDARWRALLELSDIASVAVAVPGPPALHVARSTSAESLNPPAVGAIPGHVAIVGFHVAAHRLGPGTPSLLSLRPAPNLSSLPTSTGPLELVHEVAERLAVAAHRQARGGLAVGRADLLAYAAFAAGVCGHGSVLAHAAWRTAEHLVPAGDASRASRTTAAAMNRLRRAHDQWAAIQRLWIRLATTTTGLRGSGSEAAQALEALAQMTRPGGRWAESATLMPDRNSAAQHLNDLAGALRRLPVLADRSQTIVGQWQARHMLFEPTKDRPDLDLPRPWAPARDQTVEPLLAAYDQVRRTAVSPALGLHTVARLADHRLSVPQRRSVAARVESASPRLHQSL